MTWTCYPQQIDLPDAFVAAPGVWYSGEPVQGLGTLAAFVVDDAPVVCLAANIAPAIRVTVDGSPFVLDREPGLYAGHAWFGGGGRRMFFHSAARDVWIYYRPASSGAPTEPSLYLDAGGALSGDNWYESVAALPSPRSTSSPIALTPRGPNAATAATATFEIVWPRWERSGYDHSGADVAGIYQPTGGQSGGPITLGVPTWIGTTGIFAQTFRLLADGALVAADGSRADPVTLRFDGALDGYAVAAPPVARATVSIVDADTREVADTLEWRGVAVDPVTDRASAVRVAEVSGWLW